MDSLGIIGRIESLNSIGQYNLSEARYYSFVELDPSLSKTIVSPTGGALVCNTTVYPPVVMEMKIYSGGTSCCLCFGCGVLEG